MFLNQGVIQAKFGFETIRASTCWGKFGAVPNQHMAMVLFCKTGRGRESIIQKDGKKLPSFLVFETLYPRNVWCFLFFLEMCLP